MILSRMVPSSLNMSSYRAIWIHFRSNSMMFAKKNVTKIVTKIGALRSHSKIRVVQEGHAYLHAHVHHICKDTSR